MTDLAENVRAFSDKEIAVFEAVAKLLNQGRELHNLKVAEIAAAANIGKGTAYEYFTSKEELLHKAFHYHIINEYEQIRALANRSGTFRQTFQDLLDYSDEMMRSRMPNLWAMLSTLNQDEIQVMTADTHFSLIDIMNRLDDMIEKIMQQGINEGLISADTDRSYRHFALSGAVSAYIHATQRLECMGHQPETAGDTGLVPGTSMDTSASVPGTKKDALKEAAWYMLRKALN